MKTGISIFILSLLTTAYISAQTLDDALRFSHVSITGTARSASMGNAFGALGGDFSSLSINPAGIAIYRSSEVSVSPSVNFNTSSSMYTGMYSEDKETSWPFAQAGAVFTNRTFKPGNKGLISTHFAIGYNRNNNFNQNIPVNGKVEQSSLLGQFVINGEGSTPDNLNQFGSQLAFDTWLLDTLPGINDSYFNAYEGIDNNNTVFWRAGNGLDQSRQTYKDGYAGEYLFSFGANISQKFMFGASLNIQSIQYTESSYYSEYNTYGMTPEFSTDLDHYTYHTYLHQSGTGFNFKFGVIARPLPFLRLGAAIHTPTYYNIWEHYNSDMTAVYLDDSIYVANSPYGEYNYKYRTPFKATGSAALVLGKQLIVSFDYEFQSYKSTEFNPLQYSDDYFRYLNEQIDEKFKNTNNFRAGIEFKPTPNIGLRGGFSTQETPYKKEYQDNKSKFFTYSGGIGYRTLKYFIDAAYVLTTSEYDFYNYNYSDEDGDYYGYDPAQPARIKSKDNRVIITLGYRF
jgi:hypothetical protein